MGLAARSETSEDRGPKAEEGREMKTPIPEKRRYPSVPCEPSRGKSSEERGERSADVARAGDVDCVAPDVAFANVACLSLALVAALVAVQLLVHQLARSRHPKLLVVFSLPFLRCRPFPVALQRASVGESALESRGPVVQEAANSERIV